MIQVRERVAKLFNGDAHLIKQLVAVDIAQDKLFSIRICVIAEVVLLVLGKNVLGTGI